MLRPKVKGSLEKTCFWFLLILAPSLKKEGLITVYLLKNILNQ